MPELLSPAGNFEKLRAADVTAYVDVTGLSVGEYILPLEFRVENQDVSSLTFEATPATIVATIFEH